MTRIAAARPIEQTADDANPRAVIGGNRPPVDEMARADFNEAIDGHAGLRQRIADLLGSASRAAATDDETAGRCAELIRQMGAVEKVVDDDRTKVKAPYLAGGRAIDDAAKTLVAELGTAKGKVGGVAEGYMRDKQRREDERRRAIEAEQRRQREEQLAREAEERERAAAENRKPEPVAAAPAYAPPPPIEPARVRSDFGAIASARKVWKAEVEDYGKAFKAVKSNPGVREAIDKAVAGLVRAGTREITGVRIFEDIGLSVR